MKLVFLQVIFLECTLNIVEGRNWKVSLVDASPGTAGGYKEIIFEVSGNDEVYGLLKV